jgi:hypothetical protein
MDISRLSTQLHGLIATLCPVFIWLGLVGFFLAICFAMQDGVKELHRLHQVPCSRCAFFTNDYRLKCTVHPCKALTKAAIDCRDYESCNSQTVRVPANHFLTKMLRFR